MNLIKIIVSLSFFLSLIRATSVALFLPANQDMLGQIDFRVYTALNYLLLLLLFAYVFLNNNYRFVIELLRRPMTLFLIIGAAISIALSMEIKESIKHFITLLVTTAPIVIYALTYGSRKMIFSFGIFILAMAFLNILYTLAMPQYAIMVGEHAGRWKGLLAHKNDFGPFSAIGFFVLLYCYRNAMPFHRLMIIGALPLLLAFTFLAKSATALVCFVLLALFYPMFLIAFRMHPKERFFLFFGVLAVLPLLIIVLGPVLSDLMLQLTGRDATLTGRTGIWEVMIGAVWESPMFGYGTGMSKQPSFMAMFHSDIGWNAGSAHNSYIDLFLDYGLPMGALIIYLILKTFFGGVLRPYTTNTGVAKNAIACCLVLAALVNAFASSGALLGISSFWMFAVVGLTLLMIKEPEEKIFKTPIKAEGKYA